MKGKVNNSLPDLIEIIEDDLASNKIEYLKNNHTKCKVLNE